jgi:hypothetical protein
MASKTVTREQAESKRQQAVDFMNRTGHYDAADEFDAMDVDEYAEHKGLTLTNPKSQRKGGCFSMANGNGALTKDDLREILDNVQEILDSAYTPESSREDLAAAVGEALDAISGPEEEEDLEDEDDLD